MLLEIKIGEIYYSRRNYRAKVLRFVSDARRCWIKYVEYEMVDQTFDSPPGEKFVLPMTLFKLWFTETEKPEPNPLGVYAVQRKNSVGFTDVWFLVDDGAHYWPVGMIRYNENQAMPFSEAMLFEVPHLEATLAWIPLVPAHPYIRGMALEVATNWPGCGSDATASYIRDWLSVVYATPPLGTGPEDENWRDWVVDYPSIHGGRGFDLTEEFRPVGLGELKSLEQLSPKTAKLFDQIRNGEYLCKWGVYEHLQATDGFDR